jgi:hypothetical protein
MAVYTYPGSQGSGQYATIRDTLQAQFQQGQYPDRLIYEGYTTDDTATELFIEGLSNCRLYLPAFEHAIFVEFNGIAINVTDSSAQTTIWHNALIACERTAAGTFQLANGVDLDGTGSVGNPIVVGVEAKGEGTVRYGAALTLGLAVQGAATDDPYIEVKVTGTASKTIYYRIEALPLFVAARTNSDYEFTHSA